MKIANEARTKGGPALLTAWHFAAKHQPYEQVIQAIRQNQPKSFYESKCKQLYHSVHCGRMSQEKFQRTMGELEVWGEALAQLF